MVRYSGSWLRSNAGVIMMTKMKMNKPTTRGRLVSFSSFCSGAGACTESPPTTVCHLVDEFIKSCSSVVSKNRSPRGFYRQPNCQHSPPQHGKTFITVLSYKWHQSESQLACRHRVRNILRCAKLHFNSICKYEVFNPSLQKINVFIYMYFTLKCCVIPLVELASI